MDISEYELIENQYNYYIKVFESTLVNTEENSFEDVEDVWDYKECFKDLFDTIGMLVNKYHEDAMKDSWYKHGGGHEAIFGTKVIDDSE